MECHNIEDFTDKNAKADSAVRIEDFVSACQISNSDEWFDDEVHDVASYLNKEYYKHKK